MVRRGGDADASGEGTSWLVLRHVQAEGLGLLVNVLRDRGKLTPTNVDVLASTHPEAGYAVRLLRQDLDQLRAMLEAKS